ncbi:MAG: sigma-70 family RNA polymerase sigma factor [Phycisphaeraceae bacterium]|nr:sigma-70 family RNA polymerase sigma factor [Phycisphaeraceae bacterium]
MSRPQKPDSRSSVAALLMRHRDALYAYVLSCLRSHNDVEDVLQNVSVAVIETEDPPTEDDQFLAWSREIARRRVLEHWRKSKRLLPIDPLIAQRLAEAADRMERQHPSSPRREALLACLQKLPPESQQLIAARYDGSARDVCDLARRFGRSEQGVYSLLYRIRNALRSCVDQQMSTEA